MSALSLGIDLGTTAVKVVAVDEKGHVTASGSAGHEQPRSPSPGRAEADLTTWFDSLLRALASIPPDVLSSVDVIGLSGNMSSVVLSDRRGDSESPAILLADKRGAQDIAALPDRLVSWIRAGSGNCPGVVFSLSTLLWLARAEPERLGSATVCSAKDWLRMRLCGSAPESDVTDAFNTLLVSRDSRQWDFDLVDALGLPASSLPPLRASDEVVGTVSVDAAAVTGLSEGTPIVTGGGDMATLALGGGFGVSDEVEGTTALISLGTSMTVLLPAQAAESSRGVGITWHPLFEAESAFGLCSLVTGGLALNWLTSLTGARLDGLPVRILAEDDPLVLIPHLAGSAFPDPRPQVRGAVIGLDASTDAPALASALFEALAFELLHAVEAAGNVDQVVLTGGGVHVPGLVAAVAETMPCPTVVLAEAEASARGAALLGLRGIGEADVSRELPVREVLAVEPARAARRSARRGRYLAARARVFA